MTAPRWLRPRPDPVPGLSPLARRLADRTEWRDDLLARIAATDDPSHPGDVLGARLEVAGDPAITLAAELWSRVADSIGANAEVAAGEAYLGTAQDFTDIRRVGELVGYRPAQRTAAHGFIRAEIAAGTAPVMPAGTRVQAPGTSVRPAQLYEVAEDTALLSEWAALTVTGVPVPTAPAGAQLRFLADPGFASSDQVVFIAEAGVQTAPSNWAGWLVWALAILAGEAPSTSGTSVRGVARVTKRSDDLGATLLEFDRPLDALLPAASGTSYAAYRIRDTLTIASRLDSLSYVDSDGIHTKALGATGSEPALPYSANSIIVTDAAAASIGQTLVIFGASGGEASVNTVKAITPFDWHVAPGTVRRVARIELGTGLSGTLLGAGMTVLLTDGRRLAQHYELPPLGAGASSARVHPRLQSIPPQLAIQTTDAAGGAHWELSACSADAADTDSDSGGMLVSLTGARRFAADRAAASGNVVAIRHGETSSQTLTLDASTVVLPGPVTGDVAADGTITDSLSVRVDGVEFDEVGSLYGASASDQVFTTRLAADGRLVVTFGDGVTGALPRGTVQAQWRVGGGLAGSLDETQDVSVLLGSINGVRKIGGVGAMVGAADQEDVLAMRRGTGARIRALDRVVALPDLADLALTVPGTSHSIAWRGPGPAGCACGRSGLHVAVLRRTATGVRAPVTAELLQLAGFLDARRDTSVALCVCAAVASPLAISGAVAVDARRDANAVLAAASGALLAPGGPLAAVPRQLGQPLDASDVTVVVQAVPGVVGLRDLGLAGGITPPTPGDLTLGRVEAARYELLYADAAELSRWSA